MSSNWLDELWSQRRFSEQVSGSADLAIERKRCPSESTPSDSKSSNLIDLLIDFSDQSRVDRWKQSASLSFKPDELDNKVNELSLSKHESKESLAKKTTNENEPQEKPHIDLKVASTQTELAADQNRLSNAQSVLSQLIEPTTSGLQNFIIPTLPKGKILRIQIESNWGDEQFVGLNGIEIFDAVSSKLAKIEQVNPFSFSFFNLFSN